MTQSTVRGPEAVSDRDRIAAEAVFRHHAQLGVGLLERTRRLLGMVADGDLTEYDQARSDLLGYLEAELVPHAQAEEQTIYVTAAGYAECALVIQGMLSEHAAIMELVDELTHSPTPVHAAASARALLAVFETHLAKENELIVPVIVEDPNASLADLLEGMHSLLGGEAPDDHGADCGCGGDAEGAGAASAPLLSVDPRLDVREIPHEIRHATVLGALAKLSPGGALVLVAPHAPRPLLAQINDYFQGAFTVEWLQEGPDVWQLRLVRG